eukprot:2683164-Amphidinium_carterae.1
MQQDFADSYASVGHEFIALFWASGPIIRRHARQVVTVTPSGSTIGVEVTLLVARLLVKGGAAWSQLPCKSAIQCLWEIDSLEKFRTLSTRSDKDTCMQSPFIGTRASKDHPEPHAAVNELKVPMWAVNGPKQEIEPMCPEGTQCQNNFAKHSSQTLLTVGPGCVFICCAKTFSSVIAARQIELCRLFA